MINQYVIIKKKKKKKKKRRKRRTNERNEKKENTSANTDRLHLSSHVLPYVQRTKKARRAKAKKVQAEEPQLGKK